MSINWSSTTADGTYQLKLYESTGAIDIVFGSMSVNGISTSGGGQTVVVGFSSTTEDNNFLTV